MRVRVIKRAAVRFARDIARETWHARAPLAAAAAGVCLGALASTGVMLRVVMPTLAMDARRAGQAAAAADLNRRHRADLDRAYAQGVVDMAEGRASVQTEEVTTHYIVRSPRQELRYRPSTPEALTTDSP